MASRSFMEEYAEMEFGDLACTEAADPDARPETVQPRATQAVLELGQQSKAAFPRRDPRLDPWNANSKNPELLPKKQRFSWSDHADEDVLAGIRADALREAAAKQSQGGSSSSRVIAGVAAPSGFVTAAPVGLYQWTVDAQPAVAPAVPAAAPAVPAFVTELQDERSSAEEHGLKWRQRGPPPSDDGHDTWRGQHYRKGSERWANRGGKNRAWWASFYKATKAGLSRDVAQAQADAEHGEKQ